MQCPPTGTSHREKSRHENRIISIADDFTVWYTVIIATKLWFTTPAKIFYTQNTNNTLWCIFTKDIPEIKHYLRAFLLPKHVNMWHAHWHIPKLLFWCGFFLPPFDIDVMQYKYDDFILFEIFISFVSNTIYLKKRLEFSHIIPLSFSFFFVMYPVIKSKYTFYDSENQD